MYTNQILSRIISIALFAYLGIFFLYTFSKAYESSVSRVPDIYDLWVVDNERDNSFLVYRYLVNEGLVSDSVDFDEFDYISVLAQQLSGMSKNVKPELVLAMIAVESNFDIYNRTGRAYGLMQLIPLYHSWRMEQYVETGHQIDLDDFFNPRLNIMTGIDHIDYILDETGGDVEYALMWYNQGPESASKAYLDNLYVSSYAKKVLSLSTEIKRIWEEGGH